MERTFDLTKSLAGVVEVPASAGKPEERPAFEFTDHPTNNFEVYMDKIKMHMNKLSIQFEFASRFCGHKNDASMCRHARQMFVKPCAMRDCPLLR